MSKHTCCSEKFFDKECTYDGIVDTEKHAYGVRNGEYYHYICYTKSETEVIQITNYLKRKLANHLLNLWHTGTKDGWIERILNACGYKPGGKDAD